MMAGDSTFLKILIQSDLDVLTLGGRQLCPFSQYYSFETYILLLV